MVSIAEGGGGSSKRKAGASSSKGKGRAASKSMAAIPATPSASRRDARARTRAEEVPEEEEEEEEGDSEEEEEEGGAVMHNVALEPESKRQKQQQQQQQQLSLSSSSSSSHSAASTRPAGASVPSSRVAIAERARKRTDIAKTSRLLKNRLALALFKVGRGWEEATLDTIEAHYDEQWSDARHAHTSELPESYSAVPLEPSAPLTAAANANATATASMNATGSGTATATANATAHNGLASVPEHPSSDAASQQPYPPLPLTASSSSTSSSAAPAPHPANAATTAKNKGGTRSRAASIQSNGGSRTRTTSSSSRMTREGSMQSLDRTHSAPENGLVPNASVLASGSQSASPAHEQRDSNTSVVQMARPASQSAASSQEPQYTLYTQPSPAQPLTAPMTQPPPLGQLPGYVPYAKVSGMKNSPFQQKVHQNQNQQTHSRQSSLTPASAPASVTAFSPEQTGPADATQQRKPRQRRDSHQPVSAITPGGPESARAGTPRKRGITTDGADVSTMVSVTASGHKRKPSQNTLWQNSRAILGPQSSIGGAAGAGVGPASPSKPGELQTADTPSSQRAVQYAQGQPMQQQQQQVPSQAVYTQQQEQTMHNTGYQTMHPIGQDGYAMAPGIAQTPRRGSAYQHAQPGSAGPGYPPQSAHYQYMPHHPSNLNPSPMHPSLQPPQQQHPPHFQQGQGQQQQHLHSPNTFASPQHPQHPQQQQQQQQYHPAYPVHSTPQGMHAMQQQQQQTPHQSMQPQYMPQSMPNPDYSGMGPEYGIYGYVPSQPTPQQMAQQQQMQMQQYQQQQGQSMPTPQQQQQQQQHGGSPFPAQHQQQHQMQQQPITYAITEPAIATGPIPGGNGSVNINAGAVSGRNRSMSGISHTQSEMSYAGGSQPPALDSSTISNPNSASGAGPSLASSQESSSLDTNMSGPALASSGGAHCASTSGTRPSTGTAGGGPALSASGGPAGGPDQESAAELMLFLAHSPSPKQANRKVGHSSALGGDLLKGRRLFSADGEGSDGTHSASAPGTGAGAGAEMAFNPSASGGHPGYTSQLQAPADLYAPADMAAFGQQLDQPFEFQHGHQQGLAGPGGEPFQFAQYGMVDAHGGGMGLGQEFGTAW